MRLNLTLFIAFIMAIMLSASGTTFADDANIERIKKELPEMFSQSNVGKEFWFTIPPCYEDESGGSPNFIKIFITSPVKTLVTIEIPAIGFFKTQNTVPNDVIGFDIEPARGQPFLHSGRTDDERAEEVIPKRGIHIYADDPLVVYVVVRYRYTSDGFLAVPVSAFGTEYIAASTGDMSAMYTFAKNFPSMVGVVAAYDNTNVRWTTGGNVFTETAGGLGEGESRSFRMDEGDVIMFMSNGPEHDLTGSKIQSNRPIGVVSGNHCANIPTMNRWCDYVVEMDLPTMAWGTAIPVGKIPGRTYSGLIRIFAREPNTSIFRDGAQLSVIPKSGGMVGQGYQIQRIYPGTPSRSGFFSADKAFSITFYNPGVEEDIGNTNSDPFIMAMTPIEQFQKEIIFCTPAVQGGLNFPENYLNVVFELDEFGNMPGDLEFAEVRQGQFEWKSVRGTFSPSMDDVFNGTFQGKEYGLKTITLPGDGVYRIRSSRPFASYSFGYSSYDSYGYPTSAALADLSKPDTVAPIPIWEIDCEGTVSGATVTDKPDDDQIRSNLAMITFHKNESFNYDYDYEEFVPGETITTTWEAWVLDKKKDARAIFTFGDRRGNDTTIQIDYYATKLDLFEKLVDFGNFKPGESKTIDNFRVKNLSTTSPAIIPSADKLRLKSGAENFTMDIGGITFPLTLEPDPNPENPNPNSQAFFSITFTAPDEPGFFTDSIGVGDDCVFEYIVRVEATVGAPQIVVSDHDFGPLPVGTQKTTTISISNPGSQDLVITGYTEPTNSAYTHDLPVISQDKPLIVKNGQPYNYQVTFKPTVADIQYPDQMVFENDADDYPDHICLLNGSAIQAELGAIGVNWPILRIHRTTRPEWARGPYEGATDIEVWNDGTNQATLLGIDPASWTVIDKPASLSDQQTIDAFIFDKGIFNNMRLDPDQKEAVDVKFQPTAIGNYHISFDILTDQPGVILPVELQGSGKLGEISITESIDFGSTFIFDVGNVQQRTMTITNENYGQYADTVTITDLISADINEDFLNWGALGFRYDKAAANLPIVLAPGESVDIDGYFVAQQVNPVGANIATWSDAKEEKDSDWSGFGTDSDIWANGDGANLCVSESIELTLNFGIGENATDGFELYDIIPSEVLPDLVYNLPAFPVNFSPGDNPLEIRVLYTPSQVYTNKVVSFTFKARYPNGDEEERTADLTLNSEQYFRGTNSTLSAASVKPYGTSEPIFYAIDLENGTDMTMADVQEIVISIQYKTDFLDADDGSLAVGAAYAGNFSISNPNFVYDPVTKIETITFSLKSNGGSIINQGGEIVTMTFFPYFIHYTPEEVGQIIKDNSVTITHNINMILDGTGNESGCISITGSEVTTALEDVCAPDLRPVLLSNVDYELGEAMPNPVGANGAEIDYSVGLKLHTEIKIYNSNGEVVATPVSGVMPIGEHKFNVPVDELASGVYYYEMTSGDYKETKKLVVNK